MAKQTFTTGQVLTAAQQNALQANDYNQTVTTVTTNYVLLAADVGTRVYMNAAGSTTITVNSGLFAAGDTLFLGNIGAGSTVVTPGTATVSKFSTASLTLSQYQGAFLYFVSTGVAILYSDSAGASTPLTTKGDLFGYDTANARVPIGTNNQVLTADSAQALGLKWATAGSTFSGCSVTKSASQSAANGAATAVSFNTENLDTDAYHDTATNNSRITIPAGKAGKYLVNVNLAFAPNATGYRALYIYKNGTNTYGTYTSATGGSSQNTTQNYTIFITLAVSDYIELYGTQTSGGALNIVGNDDTPSITVFQAFLMGA